MRVDSSTDSHHPKELIDIISRVPTHTSVNDQNIINIKPIAYFKSLIFRGTHGQPHCSNVCIVPSIVINESSSIGESSDLVPIVPPTHDDRVLLSVHPQPVVGLSVVIDDVFLAVVIGGKDHRWRRISLSS